MDSAFSRWELGQDWDAVPAAKLLPLVEGAARKPTPTAAETTEQSRLTPAQPASGVPPRADYPVCQT